MKERPIIFSGSMVRAILDGRKTQTRRAVKVEKGFAITNPEPPPHFYPCPYGQPGDRLWVRETWKPSIHMPRWDSRLTLEIVSVRVERLQDISKEDAESEGVAIIESVDHGKQSARGQFAIVWESINGHGSWALNPWVWVIEFKKL